MFGKKENVGEVRHLIETVMGWGSLPEHEAYYLTFTPNLPVGAYELPVKDGSFTVHFGGDPKSSNYLYIMDGWNYTVRLYQPHKEIIDGEWIFPEVKPVK